MKVEFDGRAWQLDINAIRYRQAMTIQAFTGLSVDEWQKSIVVAPEGDVVRLPAEWITNIAALYWLMLEQNGEPGLIDDVDFEVLDFAMAFLTALADEVRRLMAEKAPAPAAAPFRRAAAPSRARGSRTTTTRKPPVQSEEATAS